MFKMSVITKGVLSCGILLTFSVVLSGQQTTSGSAGNRLTLSPPFKTITYSSAKPQGATNPFFSHGYLIQLVHHTTLAGHPNIYLWNSSGQLEHKVAIWPAGATKLLLTSSDVGASRQLVFAGRATKVDGSQLNFIATSNLNGENTNYFNTGDYLSTQIVQADDGSIWAIGAERSKNEQVAGAITKKWANYDTLRHYSSSGALIGHCLPRWGSNTAYVIGETDPTGKMKLQAYDALRNPVAEYTAPLWGPQGGYVAPSGTAIQSWLKSFNDGVVLYDGRSGTLYYFNASNQELLSRGVDIQYSKASTLTGFTVLSDERIFASMRTNDPRHPSNLGIFEMTASNSAGGLAKWSQVPRDESAQPSLSRQLSLLGSDGTAVVFRTATGEVKWSEVK
jgi:hypothetical protein